MSSTFKSVVLYSICFTLGLSLFFSIHEEKMTYRDPAAFGGKVFQLSNLSSEEIRNQIVNRIKVYPTLDGKKSIQLNGFSSGLCKNYQEIEMNFKAEGVTVAGDSPSLKITTPCEQGQDPSEMAQIKIPVEKILNEKPKNAQYSFDGFISKFEFEKTSDSWPKQWILVSVIFKSTNLKNQIVQFDNSMMNDKESNKPLAIQSKTANGSSNEGHQYNNPIVMEF